MKLHASAPLPVHFPELFVHAFDPYSSRPDHLLDSNAKLDGIQEWPPDGALIIKSDFTGVTLTTCIQYCCVSASLQKENP